MSNIVQLVENFKKSQIELQAKLKADGENELKIIFKDIFVRHPGLKRFAFLGYTMGFNDGEPCYHTGITAVGIFEKKTYSGGSYWSDDCEERGELLEFLTEEGYDDIYSIEDDESPTSVNKDCATLEQASVEIAKLEDIVQMVYDTNYIIKVSLLENGEIEFDYDDYDCGY